MSLQLDTALETLARDPNAPLDLAEIALLLARDEYSFLDIEGQLNELDALAQEVRPYLRGHLAHQVQGLCRYLFHELGFRGNERDYYDPRNSYFNQVLERRLGIPITLSAVMMAIGQRAGLTIEGIGLPGHFIVRVRKGEQEILIDPFHGGRTLSMADCETLLENKISDVMAPILFRPLPVGKIVRRMLNNLRGIYGTNHDWPRSIQVLRRILQLEPTEIFVQRDLGISYFHHGQPGKAIDLLQSYIEKRPAQDEAIAEQIGEYDPISDVEEITQMVESARKKVAQWN